MRFALFVRRRIAGVEQESGHELHSLVDRRRFARLAGEHDHGDERPQGKFLNIIVGIVGAFLGGLLLAPLFGTGTINQYDFSFGSLIVSLLGAVVLLFIVGLFRRRRHA